MRIYTKLNRQYLTAGLILTGKTQNPAAVLAARPASAGSRDNLDDYDTICIGFPLWGYVAPHIINTFLESYDMTGKTIIPFATSGGSGMGKTNESLTPSCKGAKLIEGKVFKSRTNLSEIAIWVDNLKF